MKLNILVVDDDKLVNEFIGETLRRVRHNVTTAHSGEEAKGFLTENNYDIVLSDIKMHKVSGMDLLKFIKEKTPDTVVILMTAYGTVQNAVEAMKIGAFDYLIKPFSPDEVEMVISKAHQFMSMQSENRMLRQEVNDKYKTIVGVSKKMSEIFELIQNVAPSRSTVMIGGESGTGKELIARALHQHSDRADRQFIKLNCAALPDGLMESELFGHEKGSFTGADRQTRGRFELADGGTLLLDEISEIPIKLQGKLLRVLQEREFERVGSGETMPVDVRIIATTNRNLKKEISEGNFREDLYYRLNVIPIEIPALRDRMDDIPLLVDHFIEKYCSETGKEKMQLDDSAMRLFMKYHWPGNVRELENFMERAVVISQETTLTAKDFPNSLVLGKIDDKGGNFEVGMTVHDAEKLLILKTLKDQDGNRTRAADILGINPRTLRNKLNEYGIAEPASES
ncbi:MAG: sigma-54-dependent Fis family transcriptional regulator [candidate division Zixibacteria bacterium]|nr:sigma-54-dependent Fis family transcriptional regulator [candidate division Zixibacteria bacterium]